MDKHGDPQLTQYIEDMMQEQASARGHKACGCTVMRMCARCSEQYHHVHAH